MCFKCGASSTKHVPSGKAETAQRLDKFREASELFGSCPIKTGVVWVLTTGANILFCLGFLKRSEHWLSIPSSLLSLETLKYKDSTNFNQNLVGKS